MRRTAALLFSLALLAPFSAQAFTEKESADLKRVSSYLDGIQSMRGHFLQIGSDGSAKQGTFYLQKPGKLRFEYDKPNDSMVVVSDGVTLAVENANLKTTDRYPLLDSPLSMLSQKTIDLLGDSRVTSVKQEPGGISVTAAQKSGAAQGQITMSFDYPELMLRQWEVVDAQGLRTTVVVSNLQQVADLSPRLFVIRDLSPFSRGRQ
jgi:outer membrane lipoprotein-sorting protein